MINKKEILDTVDKEMERMEKENSVIEKILYLKEQEENTKDVKMEKMDIEDSVIQKIVNRLKRDNNKKGKIIVFEGLDCSFKETNSKRLYEYIKENVTDKVTLLSFPNYADDSSIFVKEYLDGQFGKASELDPYRASLMYTIDRLVTVEKLKLEEEYNNGYIIILDRYTGSNLIFQSSKIDDIDKKNKFLDDIINLEYNLLQLPKEDITIYMNMPLNVSYPIMKERALKNGQANDGHEMDRTYMQKVEDSALYVANRLEWNIVDCVDINHNILDKEELFLNILDVLNY